MSESTGKSARRASVNYTNNAKIQHCRFWNLLGCRSRSRSPNLSDWHGVGAGAQSPSGIRFRVRLPNVACQP